MLSIKQSFCHSFFRPSPSQSTVVYVRSLTPQYIQGCIRPVRPSNIIHSHSCTFLALHPPFSKCGATDPQLSRTNSEMYKCSPHLFNIIRVEFPPFTSPPPLQRCERER
ncbi:hypothetical protein Tsp_15311 [Trichinella spiralis]|uniref:hypothetical protein n=1 Tax=Trichinella spiralis TaxID=6334 RepID=UPI0001EFE652|nr:hypothetical protein Tsp_15311 [Trichinella spiralis]